MAKFVVYEVQEWVEWRQFRYVVEADDEEQAIQRVQYRHLHGESIIEDAEDWGKYGEDEGGESGFAATEAGGPARWAEAAKDLMENQ